MQSTCQQDVEICVGVMFNRLDMCIAGCSDGSDGSGASALKAAGHEHGQHVMLQFMQVGREGRLHDGAMSAARGVADTAKI
jgi:2,4-dienoyl-CoA reductase-like NADH-dependent reductase (Old Yellow Enzyme family)